MQEYGRFEGASSGCCRDETYEGSHHNFEILTRTSTARPTSKRRKTTVARQRKKAWSLASCFETEKLTTELHKRYTDDMSDDDADGGGSSGFDDDNSTPAKENDPDCGMSSGYDDNSTLDKENEPWSDDENVSTPPPVLTSVLASPTFTKHLFSSTDDDMKEKLAQASQLIAEVQHAEQLKKNSKGVTHSALLNLPRPKGSPKQRSLGKRAEERLSKSHIAASIVCLQLCCGKDMTAPDLYDKILNERAEFWKRSTTDQSNW
jgi:hypothetical protein